MTLLSTRNEKGELPPTRIEKAKAAQVELGLGV